MIDQLEEYWRQLRLTTLADGWWVARNLLLALIPLVVAVPLSRRANRRSTSWWMGVAVCLALLPNAAYVLADVTWFLRDVRWVDEEVAVFVLIPLYGMFFLTGFTSYTVTLMLLVRRIGPSRRHAVTIVVHFLTAVGIQLGRAHDLNSWDVAARPLLVLRRLGDTAASPPDMARVAAVALALAAFTPVYWWVLESVIDRWRVRHAGRPLLRDWAPRRSSSSAVYRHTCTSASDRST